MIILTLLIIIIILVLIIISIGNRIKIIKDNNNKIINYLYQKKIYLEKYINNISILIQSDDYYNTIEYVIKLNNIKDEIKNIDICINILIYSNQLF